MTGEQTSERCVTGKYLKKKRSCVFWMQPTSQNTEERDTCGVPHASPARYTRCSTHSRALSLRSGQHFLVCCWLLMALIRDPGKGTLKGLKPYLPPTLQYWTTVRMVRSGQWDAQAVVSDMATATLRAATAPADGVLYLIGDSTLKPKRGRKHPVGHTIRHSEHDPYMFGFEVVLLIASWDRVRVPIALGLIDPQCRGHQISCFGRCWRTLSPQRGSARLWWLPMRVLPPMRRCA